MDWNTAEALARQTQQSALILENIGITIKVLFELFASVPFVPDATRRWLMFNAVIEEAA